MQKICFKSPIGVLEIESNGKEVTALKFIARHYRSKITDHVLKKAYAELKDYFVGKRRTFTFKYSSQGTPFQKRIWAEVRRIKEGKTISYQKVAHLAGHEKAVRATGSTIGRNPLPIIVPCHRVIASNGSIGGYSGGQWRKRWLLKHEEKFKK